MKGIILAGGLGKRLKSVTPKPLVKILGKEMILRVYENMKKAGIKNFIVVVSPSIKEDVEKLLDAEIVVQEKPLGTAHALHLATKDLDSEENVLVMYSDTPLIRPKTISRLIEAHLKEKNDITILTGLTSKIYPYALVSREGGKIVDIEEYGKPSSEPPWEYSIGVYAFRVRAFREIYPDLKPRENGEVYIPDAIKLAVKRGMRVEAVVCEDEREYLGVNTPEDYKTAERILIEFEKEENQDHQSSES